jgi:acetylornithine deacetylase/succinyl-diaminopimelate desuccinylase-like protein
VKIASLLGYEITVRLASYEFTTYTRTIVRGESFAPVWHFDPEDGRVQAARAGLRQAGIADAIGTYGFCTNGSDSTGNRNIFTLGFGPGDKGAAHTTDESLAIAQLLGAVQGYKALFRSLTRG